MIGSCVLFLADVAFCMSAEPEEIKSVQEGGSWHTGWCTGVELWCCSRAGAQVGARPGLASKQKLQRRAAVEAL